MSVENSGGVPHRIAESAKHLGTRTLEYVDRVGRNYVERNSHIDNQESISQILDRVGMFVQVTDSGFVLNNFGRFEIDLFAEEKLSSFKEVVESYVALAGWIDNVSRPAVALDPEVRSELVDGHSTQTLKDEERFMLQEIRKRMALELFSFVEEDFLEQDEERIKLDGKTRLKYSKNEIKAVKEGRLLEPKDSRDIVAALVKESWSNASKNKKGRGNLTEPEYIQRMPGESEEDFKERVYLRYAFEHAVFESDESNRIREKIRSWTIPIISATLVLSIVAGVFAVNKQLDYVYPPLFQDVSGDVLNTVSRALPPLSSAATRRAIVQVDENALKDGTVAINPFGEELRTRISEPLTSTAALTGTGILTGTVNGVEGTAAYIDTNPDGSINAGKVVAADGTTYILEGVPGQTDVVAVEERPPRQLEPEIDADIPPASGSPQVQSVPQGVDTSFNPEFGVTNDRIIQWAVIPSAKVSATHPGFLGGFNIATAEINEGFARDGINGRVHSLGAVDRPGTLSFDETKESLQQIRDKVQQDENVQRKRKELGADIIVIVVEDNASCGNSYIMAKGFDSADAMRPYGILVVTRSCMETFHSLMHELGHLLALDHQAINKSVMDEVLLRLWGRGRIKNGQGDAMTYPENGSVRAPDFSNARNPNAPLKGDQGVYDQAEVVDYTLGILAQLMDMVTTPSSGGQPQNDEYKQYVPLALKNAKFGR